MSDALGVQDMVTTELHCGLISERHAAYDTGIFSECRLLTVGAQTRQTFVFAFTPSALVTACELFRASLDGLGRTRWRYV